MVKIMQEASTEDLALQMSLAEEKEANAQFAPTPHPGDLSDGGMVNGAVLTPMSGGQELKEGRPAARRAWRWDGTESLLPLVWNPEGTESDQGLRYLRKRHCTCCRFSGFYGRVCPNCRKDNCASCAGGHGQEKIIPCYYLRQEEVPFPLRAYGDIACFHQTCPRRGRWGFRTDQEMRVHANSRHHIEYRAHIEAQQADRGDRVAELEARIDSLMRLQAGATPSSRPAVQKRRTAEQKKALADRLRRGKEKAAAARAAEGAA